MKAGIPEIITLPPRTVLTVTTVGDPNRIAAPATGALYGTAFGTKFKVFKPKKREMTIGRLSAQWPDAHRKPKSAWKGVWQLEVPSFVTQRDLIQKDPKIQIKVVKASYGCVAQVLYLGPYTGEGPTITKLHAYIRDQGYRMIGAHEEEYLTRPTAKVPKTIIRYRITRR